MDPETGMTVVMIADEDGFRPAKAYEELRDEDLVALANNEFPDRHFLADDPAAIENYVRGYEFSYESPH